MRTFIVQPHNDIQEKALKAVLEALNIDFRADNGKVEEGTELISNRKPGLAKGLVKMSDDFDEPLDDFKEYM